MAPFVQEKFAEAVQAEDRAAWQRVLIGFEPDFGVCLLDAVRYRCPEAVKDVLNFRPFLNMEDSEGQRPIHLAARYGPPENVRLLLSAGCTVNASNREGWTPLHIACRIGDCAIVEELMSSGANVDAIRTEEGLTPLHVAVQAGQEQVVQILLSRVDPDIRSSVKHGRVSALAMAVMNDRPRVLETLLKSAQGFFVSLCHKTRFIKHNEIWYTDVNGSYPLHIAVETGNVECCRLLLMYSQYLKPVVHHFGHGEDTFQENCTYRREQRVLNLMNRHGCTALHSAILFNQKEMVEMLLDAGSNTDMSFEHMLLLELATHCAQPLNGAYTARVHLAMDCPRRTAKIREGIDWDESVVRLLLERSIDLEVVTKQGDYPIHLVLSAGLYGAAMMIVMRTPDKINHSNERGVTPLHLACQIRKKDRQPRLELIRSLLVMGLSVNQVTADGDTPLSLAVQDGDDEVVSILLEFSPDVNIRGSSGFRPLHHAAMGQNVAVLEALLDACPKALFIEDGCPSPLHLAISCTRVEMVECLLKRQADPSQRHPDTRETPLHAAIQLFMGSFHCHASVAMIKLLVKAGADLDARNATTAGSLTPLQSMIHALLCCSMFPNGRERSNELGLSALKTLVEAGSRLEPWTPSETGFMRRTPLQSMAFCGLLPCVYYLANIGWPLATENPPPSNGDESGNNQNMPHRQNWMCLPGNSVAQDNLHAFLLLRNANPFSLLQLAGIAIRKSLVEKSIRTHGDQRREIVSQIEKLPVPEVMKKYLNWQDADYSSAECSWEKMLHLLPSAAAKEAAKAGLTS